jgi:hypothetical protein
MRSAIKGIKRGGIMLSLSAIALLAVAPTAVAQSISTQAPAAGLSIFSTAEPTFFSPARNAGCEATPESEFGKVENCDSFTRLVVSKHSGTPKRSVCGCVD